MWFLRRRESLGRRGENIAARALRKAGYRLLARNIRIGKCEIDIIAREGDIIAFAEVKTRRSGIIPPEDSVGYAKRRHIIRAARRYIAENDDPNQYYRFDVVSVLIPDNGKPSVTILRDAFRDQ